MKYTITCKDCADVIETDDPISTLITHRDDCPHGGMHYTSPREMVEGFINNELVPADQFHWSPGEIQP